MVFAHSGNTNRASKDSPVSRIISFAGCDWYVKDGYYGPGPNYWSDSNESVWLDEAGRLHMKIRYDGSRWYCAEIFTTNYTTYGEHRFLIESDPALYDKNIVVGLFIYANDEAEVDIEFSRWGAPNNPEIGSFTVQPYTVKENTKRFAFGDAIEQSTHYFNWKENYIMFGSFVGHHYNLPSPSLKLGDWIYWGDYNPKESENLRTHINFWLMGGNSPVDVSNLEIIIKDVVQPIRAAVETIKQNTPDTFNMPENYPNPFMNRTYIDSHLDDDATVDIKVYNVMGEQVKNLRRQNNQNRIDMDMNSLSAGIYFYQVMGNETNIVKYGKMIKLK